MVRVLESYSSAFQSKVYGVVDVLMQVFGITPEQKRENRQYWGRELGKCWEKLVTTVAAEYRGDFRVGADEPFGWYAIDRFWRFRDVVIRSFAKRLRLLLFLRSDNLPAALSRKQSRA